MAPDAPSWQRLLAAAGAVILGQTLRSWGNIVIVALWIFGLAYAPNWQRLLAVAGAVILDQALRSWSKRTPRPRRDDRTPWFRHMKEDHFWGNVVIVALWIFGLAYAPGWLIFALLVMGTILFVMWRDELHGS